MKRLRNPDRGFPHYASLHAGYEFRPLNSRAMVLQITLAISEKPEMGRAGAAGGG
jgi:hypothetical protein